MKRSTKEAVALMGTKVVITYRYVEGIGEWEEKELPSPRVGWYMGRRFIKTGHTVNDGFSNRFIPESTIPCVLVVPWPFENPIRVPPDKFRPATAADDEYGPFSSAWGDDPKIRNKWIAAMAEMARDPEACPRDKKGRFVKMKRGA